jgi:hypothetical protein
LLEIDGSANGYDRHPGLSWGATMASAGRSVSTVSNHTTAGNRVIALRGKESRDVDDCDDRFA